MEDSLQRELIRRIAESVYTSYSPFEMRSRKPNYIRWSLIIIVVAVCIGGITLVWTQRPTENFIELSPPQLVADIRGGLVTRLLIYPDSVRAQYIDGRIVQNRTAGRLDIVTILLSSPDLTKLPEFVFPEPSVLDRVSSAISSFLAVILPSGLLIAIFWYLTIGTRFRNNQTLAFGKSRARMFSGDKPTVTLADIGGIKEAKESLDEMVHFLREPEIFTSLGARIPKGALLSGPPGCGKTLLAKAVAGEANVPFFSINGSEFSELYIGIGASRVRDLFDNAKRNSPCIVFIDSVDSIGLRRDFGLRRDIAIDRSETFDGGEKASVQIVDERLQTLNQLLSELDGFDTDTNVIVIIATDRPDLLDPALLRPGRIDRHIKIVPPDEGGRIEILKIHTRGKPMSEDIDFSFLAQESDGFNGADIEEWTNEAAILAAKKNKKTIYMQDFEETLTRIQSERSSGAQTNHINDLPRHQEK